MGTVGRGSGAVVSAGIEEVPRGQTARVPAGRDRWWGPGGTVVTVGQAAWHDSGTVQQINATSQKGIRKKIR